MTTICYFLVFIFETLISYVYFNNKLQAKRNKVFLLCSFTGMFFTQYFCHYIGIPNLNLIVFLITNIVVCFLCYKSSILQAVFNSFILAAIMLTTELCVFYISKSFFGTEITAYAQSDLVLYIQGACSKLLYFFAAYVISKLLVKENRIDLKVSKTSFLFLLPVASLLLLIGMAYSTENYPVNNYIYILFSVATILLIYSNLLVFWVHETIIKEQHKNMELQLQKQKNEIDVSYYQILQNHYDNSSILIHDIKRHLLSIKELSSSKNCDAINTYIDNLYDSYQINYLKKYSNNKLVNVIINRYAMACKDNNIDFYCDIRDIDFSFISDNDLTAILDNILENAFEACKNSENKTIDLKINQTNKNFISINLWNTTSIIPNIKYGKLATSKENKLLHGFGIRSIERIAKKHNGNVDFSFDKEKMIFTFNVILKNT